MPSNSEAHTKLVHDALNELAKAGYCAWKTNTGAYKKDNGFIKYGKKGGGDITIILAPHGRHVEAEAKTGKGVQNKNQKLHQKYVVEKNGGAYFLFRSVSELLQMMQLIRAERP